MSVSFFIVPIQPDKWKKEFSDLYIDSQHLKKALVDNWPKTEIILPVVGIPVLLEWRFTHHGEPSQVYELLNGSQHIAFGFDDYATEFILWYRTYVSDKYRLYLTCDAYPITKYIEITTDLNEEVIAGYL